MTLRSSRQALSEMLARLEYTRDTAGRDALREQLRQVIADIRSTRQHHDARAQSLDGAVVERTDGDTGGSRSGPTQG